MNEEMDLRDTTGEKICNFAHLWLVLAGAASAVLGIYGIIALVLEGDFVVLLVALGAGLISYVTHLVLLGYGEIVQNTRDTYRINQEILNELKNSGR